MSDKRFLQRTDSYKVTHWPVYKEGTEYVWSYLESRGGKFSELEWFGLQYYLKKYLTVRITMEMIDYAEMRAGKHFGTKKVFNRAGWEYIIKVHDGRLPIRIKTLPEGTIVPTRNILMSIENTDPNCYWLTNWVETLLLKVWYPTTVATLSREIRKVILKYLERSGTPEALPFKLHDFGYRGTSSEESAAIGGAAHLATGAMGSDTMIALELLEEYYGEDMAGFSIPATEHSIMTQGGEEGECDMMKRFLDTFGDGPYPAIACVSDTYNLWRAAKDYWGGELKAQVERCTNDKVLVVRPDSGNDPAIICMQLVETLDEQFGHTINDKGYKVLNRVRVIQGDGVTLDSITAILEILDIRGWSADNIAFGMGGALLQQCNRDTQKFAIKAASYVINGRRYDYRKDPITDSGKRSKLGRQKAILVDGVIRTVSYDTIGQDLLVTVFENGYVITEWALKDIRERAKLPVSA